MPRQSPRKDHACCFARLREIHGGASQAPQTRLDKLVAVIRRSTWSRRLCSIYPAPRPGKILELLRNRRALNRERGPQHAA